MFLLTTVYADQPIPTSQPDYILTDAHSEKTEKTEEESSGIPEDSVLNLIPANTIGCNLLSESF